MLRNQLQTVDDRTVELALFRHALAQLLQLIAAGQTAKPQQVAGLLKSGVVGQFVNVDATVGQNAPLPIDVANAGGGSDHSLQPLRGVCGSHAGHGASLELLKFRCKRPGR